MLSLRLRPISISLSPNVQGDDIFLAAKLLLTIPPSSTKLLEREFQEYLGAKYAFSFNSGRSALYTIIKSLDIKVGDEVLLQAFTCNAVPNPVLWAGGTPVYVDIDDTLNIDPEDLEKKITLRSRAVVVQHTFGVPARIDKILEIARRHNLVVIEDCAHALGVRYNDKLVGTFGDIAFFSFGRDKVISSVWGGMVTTSNDELARTIGDIHKNLPMPPRSWTTKQLLHPILFSLINPTYYIFGKYLLAFLRVVRGVGLAVSQKERMGERPSMFPAKMPEALAELALHQFGKLDAYNQHRRTIAELYYSALSNSPPNPLSYIKRGGTELETRSIPPLSVRGGEGELKVPSRVSGAIYLRFNIFNPNAKEIIRSAKRLHILLGDWYKNVIDPVGTDFVAMKYSPGSCPNAERAAQESINLPTHINILKKDAKQIVKFLLTKLNNQP